MGLELSDLGDLGELKTKVSSTVATLLEAVEVAEKFSAILPGQVKTDLDEAVTVLTALESLVNKL